MIDLLVITDGRTDYLAEAIASANANLDAAMINMRWMYDDTGDAAHREFLRREYPAFVHIHGGDRQGFGGAIRTAWQMLAAHSAARQIFHLEQDFTFNRPVELAEMSLVLDDHRNLAQIGLRRQSWNPAELAAGGVVEQHPDAYTEVHDQFGTWLEHRLFFTTNPSLYRLDLVRRGWPIGDRSEGVFSAQLFEDAAVRCAYWGARDSGEAVTHIGHQRVGVGY